MASKKQKIEDIKFDIEALKRQTITCGISDKAFNSWKTWKQSLITKLEEELEELQSAK